MTPIIIDEIIRRERLDYDTSRVLVGDEDEDEDDSDSDSDKKWEIVPKFSQ